jgi:hypothetical protein
VKLLSDGWEATIATADGDQAFMVVWKDENTLKVVVPEAARPKNSIYSSMRPTTKDVGKTHLEFW